MKMVTLFKTVLVLLLATVTLTLSAQCDGHQALIDKMDKAMAEKNPALLDDVYTADAVRHTQQGDEVGLEQIKASAAQFYENIPDASGTNRDVICTDDQVVVRWEGTGTPKGSTEKVSVTGITIMKVVKGKVVEEWEEMNSLSLMMQMGYELKPPAMTDGGKE